MKIIHTGDLKPSDLSSKTESLLVYNALDCMVTLEILEVIEAQLDNTTRSTYELSKSLQGVTMEMALRGVLVDQEKRAELIRTWAAQLSQLEGQLDRILSEGLGLFNLNWRSPAQLKTLFYDVMKIPPVRSQGKITVDRNALEKLENYFYAQPIIKHILAMRDIGKKISVLKTSIDSDNRIRTSYNIAGTTTGRLSSSYSIEGSGGNLQNVEDRLRRIFIADVGCKFAYIDLQQAESRLVGAIIWNLFKDGRYLDACESGDLHTSVSKLAWPNLNWPGDKDGDKALAETPFYRQHSHRHMAKVLGHGTNYNGQPHTMSQHTKIPSAIIKEFQSVYFAAFPGIRGWHTAVAAELEATGKLTSLMNRRRYFFGRRTDPSTIREAIAFDPQSSVADILNTGMLTVWRLNICQLMMQIHDAILIQFPEPLEDEIIPQILNAIKVPVELKHGRTLLIPADATTGWNFAKQSEGNSDGLVAYRGNDKRVRTFRPAASILDRRVYELNGRAPDT